MFSIIRTGIDASTRDLAVISNNIANASTNGFKRSEAQFEDMYQNHHNNSMEVAKGIGVKTIKPRQNFSQGSLQQTNGSLDLAIMGEGFFVLGNPVGRETPDAKLKFTRDGSFQLDRLGNLVNNEGLPLLGEGQKLINIPFAIAGGSIENEDGTTTAVERSILTEINVKTDGKIEATYGLSQKVVAGTIELGDFVNEHGLQNIGNSKFEETKESGLPTFASPKEGTMGKIQPGFLETSNTDITDELVTMLRTQHAFNGNSKILQSELEVTKRLSS